jgi:hypothetical protein
VDAELQGPANEFPSAPDEHLHIWKVIIFDEMQQRMDIGLGRQGSSHKEQVKPEVEANSEVYLVAAGALEAEVAEHTQDLHCCTLRIFRMMLSLAFRV